MPVDVADFANDVYTQVRLLIADTDPVSPVLTDLELAHFLTIEGGSLKLGAAAALEAIATSEALVGKVIRTQDLATDGAKLATALLARAKLLRDQADADGGDDDSAFTRVPYGCGGGPELAERWWG